MSSEQTIGEPAYLIHRRFGDFDEFCENAVKWDLDYRQVERGDFTSELLMAGSSQIQFAHVRLGRRLIQQGAAPAGMRTFGLLTARDSHIFWRGQHVTGDDLFLFPVGGELNSVTQSDFDAFALSLTEDIVADACHSLELPALDELQKGDEVFRVDAQELARLRQFLTRISKSLTNDAGVVTSGWLGQVADELARSLVLALSRRQAAREPRRFRRRAQALRLVGAYLSETPTQSPRLGDLCEVANVSERTLEYAFREHYGMTPKSFINAYRLNSLRKALLLADPATSKVYVAAQALGFWHLSQLSADYRALFGESPSSTLQRSA